MLGERLLIIQKKFSGFDDTKERIDLLAIDEQGNLVIIENKLDDKRACRISHRLTGVSFDKSEDWQRMRDFLTTSIVKFEKSFRDVLNEVVTK